MPSVNIDYDAEILAFNLEFYFFDKICVWYLTFFTKFFLLLKIVFLQVFTFGFVRKCKLKVYIFYNLIILKFLNIETTLLEIITLAV